MAFDLLSGETTTACWSRGDVVVDAVASRAKKLPWLKIGAIGVAGLGAFLLLGANKKKTSHGGVPRARRHDSWDQMTQEIPRESMKDLVFRNNH